MSSLKLKHSGGNSMSIEAPATNPASNLALKLPATIGSANQFVKNSGTAGTLGWSSVVEDSSGNVGIGTTSPDGNLHVHDATAGSVTASTAGNIAVFEDSASNGISLLNPNTERANIYFGTTGTGGNVEASIQYAHESVSTTADRRVMIFKTGGDGEKMRITSNGRVAIGETAPGRMFEVKNEGQTNVSCCFMHNDGSDNLRVLGLRNDRATGGTAASMIEFFKSDGTKVGSIEGDGSSTSYNTSSDYRLKENVTPISDGITRLKTLKPSRFNFKVNKDTTVDGFLAHEVTAVPEAVTGTKDQVATADDVNDEIKEGDPIYQSIDQSKLVPLLTAALQEAITKIETLETKVAALEAG
jgi:hypothetical protein